MRRTSLIVASLCVIAVCFSACKEKKFRGFTKTKTGMYYKITTKNDKGTVPQEGDYLTLSVSFDADFDSTFNFPTREMSDVLRPSVFKGDVYEAYSLLKAGEEGEFYIKADSFFLTFMGFAHPTVKPEDMLHFKIKLSEVKPKEEFEKEMAIKEKEQQELIEKKKGEEKPLLDKYIAEQKIKVKPTASGLYYIETLKGKGAKAENGKRVTVNYTGKLLDGTVFDSSEGKAPAEFVLGSGMIPGFSEGVSLMREGGKATLILPSAIAYGERGAGDKIAPCTPIIFDIELVKVSDTATVKSGK